MEEPLPERRELVTRRTVIRRLQLDADVLDHLEEMEIVVPVYRPGRERCYQPGDVDQLRVYQLLVEDLGVNPPGAEIVLRMRARIIHTHERMGRLLNEMKAQGMIEIDDVREILNAVREDFW